MREQMTAIPDHPVIRNMERTGYPDGREPRWPVCPVCGAETDTFYQGRDRAVMGCDRCVGVVDAWEELERTRRERDERGE